MKLTIRSTSAVKSKPKRIVLPRKVYIYPAQEGTDAMVTFEDASFDFDQLENVLNLYQGIPSRNREVTRCFTAKTDAALLQIVLLAGKNLPAKNDESAKRMFTPEFAKHYMGYFNSLFAAKLALQHRADEKAEKAKKG